MSEAQTTASSTGELPSGVVQEIAQSVAQMIATRTSEPGARPQIRLESPDGAVELSNMAGSFTLAILYKTTTYTLTVTIPSGPSASYVFKLEEKVGAADPEELASFTYKASNDWRVKVSIPEIKVSDTFKIETISLELSDTPPPPPV